MKCKSDSERVNNATVTIGHIANVLPVNKKFDNAQFCRLTGIRTKSANARLLTLAKNKHIRVCDATKAYCERRYVMTGEMQKRMTERCATNKAKKGKRNPKVQTPSLSELELIAARNKLVKKRNACEDVLKKAGLL